MQVFTVWTYTVRPATDKNTTLFLQHYQHFLNPLLKKYIYSVDEILKETQAHSCFVGSSIHIGKPLPATQRQERLRECKCEQIPTRDYKIGFLAKWQDTFYSGFTSAECPWITSCGTGSLKQMNLSFSFFLRNAKLKALMQTVLYVALLLFCL